MFMMIIKKNSGHHRLAPRLLLFSLSFFQEVGCVRELRMSACGMFSFVEFWTEELASTAMEFNGFEFLGRALKIGRPSGFSFTQPPPPPLDVSVIKGRLSEVPKAAQAAVNDPSTKAQRELYVGNLPVSQFVSVVRAHKFGDSSFLLPGLCLLSFFPVCFS